MLRRLFYLLPDESCSTTLMADLQNAGIARTSLHAATRHGQPLLGFPPASARQQHDGVWRLQNWLWSGNLVLFSVAALAVALALYTGFALTALTALIVMLAAAAAGVVFVYHMPDTHLGELDTAIGHGDIVLMVDVPKSRTDEIAQLIRQRHPEAEASGVGWTISALGL